MKRSLINRCVAIAMGVLSLLPLTAFGGMNLQNVRSGAFYVQRARTRRSTDH